MQPLDAGQRHCASCQQMVHDFTQFSDAELVSWFAQHEGPTCGRLRDDQLRLPLFDNQSVAPKGVGNRVRWALALMLGWPFPVWAQTGTSVPNKTVPPMAINPIGIRSTLSAPQSDAALFYVRGQVFYSDGKPAVALIQKATKSPFIFSGEDGHFAIPIYAADQQTDSLQIDFEGKKLTVFTKQEGPPLVITLGYCPHVISGGSIVVHKASLPKRYWWSVKRLFVKR